MPVHQEPADISRTLLATVLIGVGLIAAVDEIIFHQILAWHHFFDRDTSAIALLSDGLLHAAELLLLIAGFLLFADLRYRRVLAGRWAWAGLFLGLGGFQLFDGIIDHKVLRLHQIRYGIENLPLYDLIWSGAGFILLVIGVVLLRRARGHNAPSTTR